MPEFATDDGLTLHYRVGGTGPIAVFYLHWMGGDVTEWEGLWRALGTEKFRHVALDFRGHGESDKDVSIFSNERLARDVLQLADELQVDRFAVIGHSFGGKVALRLAATVPARVAGLVLIGAVGPGRVPLEREAVELILARANELEFVRDTFRPWFSVWPRTELDRALESFARTPAKSHRVVCEIALWTDITAAVGQLTTPALIIAGENDAVYGPAYQRDAVLPAIPRAKMVSVDCGHGLALERPEEIAGHCNQFLEELTW